MRSALLFIEVFRKTKEQKVAQKVEDRFFDRGIASLGRRHRALDHRAILLAHRFSRFQIGAINGKTCDRFAHRPGQRFQSVIAKPAIMFRQPIHHVAKNVNFVGQGNAHDQPLLGVNEVAEVQGVTDETLEDFANRAFGVVIDQHARDLIGKIVAVCAVDRPVFR